MKFMISLPFFLCSCLISDSCIPVQQDYQGFVDKITSYHEKAGFIKKGTGKTIDTNKFKVNDYFSLFDKIKMEKGWKLHFYYHYDGMGGYPVFMALRENQAFEKVFPSEEKSSAVWKYVDSIPLFDHIEVDPSPMGYFQYMVFLLKGSNFALFWHSGYGFNELLCSKKACNELASRKVDYLKFNTEQKNKLRNLNPEPVIEETADSCFIQLHLFNAWAGVTKMNFAISKVFPHRIKRGKEELIMQYSCGLIF
ncbi:MAG: hypothetical protein V2A54_17685 [Bacteroidota bacterium]